jgi:hypothetical protein
MHTLKTFRKNSSIYSKLVVEEVRLKDKIAQDKIVRGKIVLDKND